MVLKFNNGNGAIVCDKCSITIASGRKQMAESGENKDHLKHYCSKCIVNKTVDEVLEECPDLFTNEKYDD